MKRIHIDDYKSRLSLFIKKHGKFQEACEETDFGNSYKVVSFDDGATWNECRKKDGTVEFWNSEDSTSIIVDGGAENEWLSLGGGFSVRLNEKYAKDFDMAHFFLTKNGRYMRVELISSWNSSYDEKRYFPVANHGTPINIMAEFLQ